MSDELPEILSNERVYEGPLVAVDHARLRFPDGSEGDRQTVVHPGAVALVALLDDDRLLLVEQYRHPARQRLLEVPAGTREPGEPPAVTARRELREETGYDAESIVRIGGAWMAPGFTNEYIDIYLATGLFEAPLDTGDEEDLGRADRDHARGTRCRHRRGAGGGREDDHRVPPLRPLRARSAPARELNPRAATRRATCPPSR